MNVSGLYNSNIYKVENRRQNSRQSVAFGATLPQIEAGLKTAQLCASKKALVEQFIESAKSLQEIGLKEPVVLKLNSKKQKPPQAINTENTSALAFIKWLQNGSFSCGTKALCKCGKDKSIGQVLSECFAKLSIEKPNKIKLKPQK